MFGKRMIYGVRHEKHMTRSGYKHRCVPFTIDTTRPLYMDDFQGAISPLVAIQFLSSKRCAEDTAERWNEFHRRNHMLYDEVAEAENKMAKDITIASVYKNYKGKEGEVNEKQ